MGERTLRCPHGVERLRCAHEIQRLRGACGPRLGPWLAIAFSALLFGVVHMNWAQGFHGFIMGLLLGWLYYRTGSMMPGIIVHWVNNTVAYLMFKLLPGMADGQLIDFFHGSERLMVVGLLCSLSILVPSLFQIILRTKK